MAPVKMLCLQLWWSICETLSRCSARKWEAKLSGNVNVAQPHAAGKTRQNTDEELMQLEGKQRLLFWQISGALWRSALCYSVKPPSLNCSHPVDCCRCYQSLLSPWCERWYFIPDRNVMFYSIRRPGEGLSSSPTDRPTQNRCATSPAVTIMYRTFPCRHNKLYTLLYFAGVSRPFCKKAVDERKHKQRCVNKRW